MDQEKTLTLAKAAGYTVKGIKSFQGNEGLGFNATLYRNGKKVAFVIDDANGGCFSWHFANKEAEKELTDFVRTLPGWKYQGVAITTDSDMMMSLLVEDTENTQAEIRSFKRKCRTKTLIRTTDCKPGQFIEFNIPWSLTVKMKLIEKFSGKITEFINETMGATA